MQVINMYDILADLHTHTIFSLHAFSTVAENIAEAQKMGLKYLAITDHFYGYSDPILSKNEYNRIEHLTDTISVPGLTLIGGVELNLNQYPDKAINVPWKPVGIHSWFIDRETTRLEDVEREFDFLLSRGTANAIAHIEREIHKLDYGFYKDTLHDDVKRFLTKMVMYAKEHNIPMELNESSLAKDECGGVKRAEYWISQAKEIGVTLYLGSDAHYYTAIGKFPLAIELLKKVNYPEDRIINCNPDLLKIYFDKKE